MGFIFHILVLWTVAILGGSSWTVIREVPAAITCKLLLTSSGPAQTGDTF